MLHLLAIFFDINLCRYVRSWSKLTFRLRPADSALPITELR
jgi:hypothetical protein